VNTIGRRPPGVRQSQLPPFYATARRTNIQGRQLRLPHSRPVIAILLLAIAPAALACPVCFGAPNDPMVKGVNNGIWVLLALVALVQVGFAAMFWSFWRRAREQKRFRDSLRVIHSYDREGPFS
jgi:hypothetical protein